MQTRDIQTTVYVQGYHTSRICRIVQTTYQIATI